MTKIAIVGAGSLVFTRKLVTDLLQQDETADAELHLVDVDPQRLSDVRQVVEGMRDRAGSPASVVATTECAEGVRGCDYVINTISVGGRAATDADFDLPERFGVRQTIADTHGIGGISRALRTLPAVLEVARTVQRCAPDAWFLNYTNPMAMVVLALATLDLPVYVGLCHGTDNTAREIAGYLEVPDPEQLAWQAAGINHMTWFLSLAVDGVDVYPALRAFAAEADLSAHEDAVRLELLRRFGYFVSESSVHNAEYYPWFLRSDAEIERRHLRVREYLYRLDELEHGFAREQAAISGGAGKEPLAPRSNEYAPRVIAANESNTAYRFMGNVTNSAGLVANLPTASCVEVPCFVDAGAVLPGAVGSLPEQCAALNRASINVQLLTVQGILEHKKEAIYQAAFLDPLLSSQLTLDEITALVDALIEAHGNPSSLR